MGISCHKQVRLCQLVDLRSTYQTVRRRLGFRRVTDRRRLSYVRMTILMPEGNPMAENPGPHANIHALPPELLAEVFRSDSLGL